MKATRVFALILAMIMLCSTLLIGCSGEQKKSTEEVAPLPTVDTEDRSEFYDAEVKNLNGYEFTFIARESTTNWHLAAHEIYASEKNGDKINDAVFSRNALLEQTYNCKIKEIRQSNPATYARPALIAGDYIADFLYGTVNQLKTLAGGLVADFSQLSTVDLTKAWWDQQAIDGVNLATPIHMVTGDASTLDERASGILGANLDAIAEWDPNYNLYDVIRKGEWTYDEMYKIMVNTAKADGDGQFNSRKYDRFGYTSAKNATQSWVLATGARMTLYDADGNLYFPDSLSPEVLTAWEAMRPIMTSHVRAISDDASYYRQGLSTFMGTSVAMVMRQATNEHTFHKAYIPIPKMNKELPYMVAANYVQLGVFSIPWTVSEAEGKLWQTNGFKSAAEQAAYFLEAFSYYSRQTLTPAFFDQILYKQAVDDVDSVEMIQIATANKVYDPGPVYGFGMNIFGVCEVDDVGKFGNDANYNKLTSTYQERLTAGREALKTLMQTLNANERPTE